MEEHNFGWVLQYLRAGQLVTRETWNRPGRCIGLQVPDQYSKMTLPYIFYTTARGERVPWVPTQTDLLATDWMVVPARDTQGGGANETGDHPGDASGRQDS